MQLTDLRTDARWLISPQLTSADYPDLDLDRNLNLRYRELFVLAFGEQGDWEIEGDLIYRDFKAATTDYEIPANLVRIFKGEVMYETGGSFVPLKFISIQREQDAVEGNATRLRDDVMQPTAELFGNYLQVRPAPVATVVNGIKLWAQLDLVDLDANNNVPNFVEAAQRFISVGAALDFAVGEEMKDKELSLKRFLYGDPRVKDDMGLSGAVKAVYANRTGARRQGLSAKRLNFR